MDEGGETEKGVNENQTALPSFEKRLFKPTAIAPETKDEQQRFIIPFVDTRDEPFPEQIEALQGRLTEDKVDIALLQTKQLLGKYARRAAQDISIKIKPGERMGAGQVIDGMIDLEMPSPQVIEAIRQRPHPLFGVLPAEQFNTLSMATAASTVLHEGIHGLLNSRPDSVFAQDLERISGLENQYGQVATLLDEGIAYAIQSLYAASVEPVGSLAPQINSTDTFTERTRKELGEKLKPLLADYITQGKSVDEVLLAQTGDMLKGMELQRYIEEYKKEHNIQ